MSSKYATTSNLCCDENVRHYSERGSVISCCLHLLEMLKHVDFTSQMISNRNTLVKRHPCNAESFIENCNFIYTANHP